MKKFFSLFAAVLFAGSMMADTYSFTFEKGELTTSTTEFTKGDVTWTLSNPENQWNGTAGKTGYVFGTANAPVTLTISTSDIEGTITEISVVGRSHKKDQTATVSAKVGDTDFAGSNNTWNNGDNQTATFTGSAEGKIEVTITPDACGFVLAGISVEYTTSGTPEPKQEYYLVGSVIGWEAKAEYKLAANPGQEGEYMIEYTAAEGEGLKVLGVKGEAQTWFKDGTGNEYVVENAGDYTIYFRPEGNEDWEYVYFILIEKVAPAGPTNCAEAAEAALSVSKNNELYNDGAEYTIEGYVTEIAYAWSSSSKNMSFWMADTKDGGKVLEAYKCAIENAEDAVAVGDKVAVTGKLTKYNTTPEFAAGCTVVILERDAAPVNLGAKTIAEFLALKNTKDTCVLTGTVENIVMDKDDNTKYNKYGNFDLVDETGSVYVYGLLTADGKSGQFIEMDIDEGDELTVKAIYTEYNSQPQAKNAIFVSVKKNPTAINNTNAEVKAVKVIRNGQMFIEKNGVLYNAQGAQVR